MAKRKPNLFKEKLLLVLIIALGLMLYKLYLVKKSHNSKISNKFQITHLDLSVCDPKKANFSSTIDNPFFPYPVGKVDVLESDLEKVQITSLDKTETVADIETRVIEEREWANNNLSEVSQNYFAQAPDGTVCYFGEAVDEYDSGEVVGHEGSWRADEGENRPGIMMPATPEVGQNYEQEVAPGVAMDRAEHLQFEKSFTTPAGTFQNVLLVKESPASTKRYASGVGLIFDDGAVLTKN